MIMQQQGIKYFSNFTRIQKEGSLRFGSNIRMEIMTDALSMY